jgi:hypothetical protein
MMKDMTGQIVDRIYGYGRGSVFTPKDFLDIASHETIRKALARLTYSKKIRRLGRGIYEYPAFSRLLQAPSSPDPDAIARAIARAHGWVILPSGDTALNLLGLSTQVPARWEYFSDGPSKTYKWSTGGGGGSLIFKHRANKETTILSPKTAMLVQALKTLGEKNIDKSVMAKLLKQFSTDERNKAVHEARYATSWVYEIIKRLAKEREPRNA